MMDSESLKEWAKRHEERHWMRQEDSQIIGDDAYSLVLLAIDLTQRVEKLEQMLLQNAIVRID